MSQSAPESAATPALPTKSAHRGGVSRRTLAAGVAWSVPLVAAVSAAPAFATSATNCTAATLDWANAGTSLSNGEIVPIKTSAGTIVGYAKVTYTTGATMVGSSGSYNMTIGKTAWGSAYGAYTINTTGGNNDLILDQATNGAATTVTVSLYKDAAATVPLTAYNVQVPLDDMSSGTTWSCFIGCTLTTSKSYEEAWSIVGTSPTGTTYTTTSGGISVVGLQNPYSNPNSTLANLSGNGTAASPWYFSAQNLTSSSANSVGGNLITKFTNAAGLTSFSVTYGGNPTQWAQSNNLSGAQGSGIGVISLCV